MITELFLLFITLCAGLVRKDESLPALLYCLVSYIFYFIGTNIEDPLSIFKLAALAELSLISLLYCLKGCIRSTIIKYLIPISLLAILMHFYGWTMEVNGEPLNNYNHLVILYWCIVSSLFLSVSRWSGNIIGNNRFLRDANNRNNYLEALFK